MIAASPAGCEARARSWLLAPWLLALVFPAMAQGAELRLVVQDAKKARVADAVVSLHALGHGGAVPAGRAVMDQRNSQFTPGVLPITVGTIVTFPNSDNIRHQVYSFSPAKTFDLPLYAGTLAAPVRFEQAGIVPVGCNIHDWMIGWIVVLDTPYFGKTSADGSVALEAPAGRYRLRAWHPRISADLVEEVSLADGGGEPRMLQVKLNPPPPPRRGNRRLKPMPATGPGG